MDLKTCSRCHEAKTLSSFSVKRDKLNAQCKNCVSIYGKQYRAQNQEKEKLRHKQHWEQYKGTNAQRQVNKNKCKRYQQNHLHKFREYEARRRATQNNATPLWVDVDELKQIYSNCPIGYEVDHIVPISHLNVCGLHIPNNLQYLPRSENRSKSNKFQ